MGHFRVDSVHLWKKSLSTEKLVEVEGHWRAGPLFSRGAISSFSQKNAYFYDVLLKFSAKKTFLGGQLPPPPPPPSWPADVEGYINLQRVTNPCLFFRGKKIYERVDQAHKLI
jgi:hypothetical protein